MLLAFSPSLLFASFSFSLLEALRCWRNRSTKDWIRFQSSTVRTLPAPARCCTMLKQQEHAKDWINQSSSCEDTSAILRRVTILFDTLTQTNIGVLLKCIALWKVRIPSLWHSSKRRARVYHTSLQWQRMYLHHVIMLGASPSNKNQTHRYVLYSLSTLQYGSYFFSSSSSLLLILSCSHSTNVLYICPSVDRT